MAEIAAATETAAASPKPLGERTAALRVLATEAAECTDCRLHQGRTKSVFARGQAGALVAFVGEGPGFHEDQQGVPFVGKAGQLLDKMIQAMGLADHEYYICNVVKCRPPQNRTPKPDEGAACARFLVPQLELVAPQVIVALGRAATEQLGLATAEQRGWRGRWGAWRDIPAIATFHPAYLLRSPEHKRPVWQDLRAVMKRVGRPV